MIRVDVERENERITARLRIEAYGIFHVFIGDRATTHEAKQTLPVVAATRPQASAVAGRARCGSRDALGMVAGISCA